MKVPKHIVKFAEASMEQAALITFAKKLNLRETKFLDASRDTGVKFSYRIPQTICYRSNNESTEPPTLPVSSALAVFDELSSYAFVTKDRTCRFGVSVYLSTEILHAIPAGADVIVTAKAKKIGKTLGFATMEMHNLEGLLLARGDHIKHLPMGSMWDNLALFLQSRFVLPIILKHGEFLNNIKSKFLTDSQIVKFMVGRGLERIKPEIVEETNNDVGIIFQSLGLIQKKNFSDQKNDFDKIYSKIDENEEKNENRIDSISGKSESKNTDLHSVGIFSLKVRPILMNFLGRLHGGALAMSIEQAIRIHTHTLPPTRPGKTLFNNDNIEGNGREMVTKNNGNNEMGEFKDERYGNGILGQQDSTIVRMEVTYKSAMTSELDITCTDDVHSISIYTTEKNNSIPLGNKYRIQSRRTVGEVFNHAKNKNKSSDERDDSGYVGPAATYTCYWSASP